MPASAPAYLRSSASRSGLLAGERRAAPCYENHAELGGRCRRRGWTSAARARARRTQRSTLTRRSRVGSSVRLKTLDYYSVMAACTARGLQMRMQSMHSLHAQSRGTLLQTSVSALGSAGSVQAATRTGARASALEAARASLRWGVSTRGATRCFQARHASKAQPGCGSQGLSRA